MRRAFTTIDDYISAYPAATQKLLQKVRAVIRKAAPDAEEKISYAIPTFYFHGNLVHFAGYDHHIGFYPGANGIAVFNKKLASYKGAKGSVQFPLDQSIPYDIIAEIVTFRYEENKLKAQPKKAVRTCKNGHQYYKSSDCPTCPICEAKKKPATEWMTNFGAPARRAFENAGIKSLKQFAKHSQDEIAELHGIGPNAMSKLKTIMKKQNIDFKKVKK